MRELPQQFEGRRSARPSRNLLPEGLNERSKSGVGHVRSCGHVPARAPSRTLLRSSYLPRTLRRKRCDGEAGQRSSVLRSAATADCDLGHPLCPNFRRWLNVKRWMWRSALFVFSLLFATSSTFAQPTKGQHDMLLLLPDGPVHLRVFVTDGSRSMKETRDEYLKQLVASLDRWRKNMGEGASRHNRKLPSWSGTDEKRQSHPCGQKQTGRRFR